MKLAHQDCGAVVRHVGQGHDGMVHSRRQKGPRQIHQPLALAAWSGRGAARSQHHDTCSGAVGQPGELQSRIAIGQRQVNAIVIAAVDNGMGRDMDDVVVAQRLCQSALRCLGPGKSWRVHTIG